MAAACCTSPAVLRSVHTDRDKTRRHANHQKVRVQLYAYSLLCLPSSTPPHLHQVFVPSPHLLYFHPPIILYFLCPYHQSSFSETYHWAVTTELHNSVGVVRSPVFNATHTLYIDFSSPKVTRFTKFHCYLATCTYKYPSILTSYCAVILINAVSQGEGRAKVTLPTFHISSLL